MEFQIEITQADITTLSVDAIVNAADNALLGGGGVDGAIHHAAGPDLLRACQKLGRCETGEAKITQGYRLHARYIIHTVGPVWRGGTADEAQLLASCYRKSLEIATEKQISSIAFPSISTGVYGYPVAKAAPIAITTVKTFHQSETSVTKIIFCCFSEGHFSLYHNILERVDAKANQSSGS